MFGGVAFWPCKWYTSRMKNIKAIQLFVAALAMCSAHADDIGYRFVADHADSLYRVGE